MKNIFIGGVAKSGKSRLAVDLCKKNGMNHIPLDYFTSSFKHTFPELGITSNIIIDPESSKKLSQFLTRVVDIIDSQNDEFFILDSAHILPDDILKYLNPNKWDIYYIGYPNTTAEDKLDEVNKYTKGGWVAKKSKEELLETFTKLIELSSNIEKTCRNNNINFIDTSYDDVLKVFNKDN